MDQLNIAKASLIGHSMGGKLAMATACKYPDRVESVINIDSVPLFLSKSVPSYFNQVRTIVHRMKKFDVAQKYQNQLKDETSRMLECKNIGNMLVDNMKFDDNRKCTGWKSNMPTLLDFFPDILDHEDPGTYRGPFLSINGEDNKWDKNSYIRQFPEVTEDEVVCMQGAGHSVHADKPVETLKLISDFMSKLV